MARRTGTQNIVHVVQQFWAIGTILFLCRREISTIDVWSQREMCRIDLEPVRLVCPDFAYELVGCQAPERLETSGIVVGFHEELEVRPELYGSRTRMAASSTSFPASSGCWDGQACACRSTQPTQLPRRFISLSNQCIRYLRWTPMFRLQYGAPQTPTLDAERGDFDLAQAGWARHWSCLVQQRIKWSGRTQVETENCPFRRLAPCSRRDCAQYCGCRPVPDRTASEDWPTYSGLVTRRALVRALQSAL
jgi:hypothetical protein